MVEIASEPPRVPHVALLIDADNTPASALPAMLADLGARGLIGVRRAYGNWAKPQLGGWQGPLLDHGIVAVHQFDHAVGKNATDLALTVDAMDLFHTCCPDILALASSDADFTPLVIRLRSSGVSVIGYGGRPATDAYRRACTEFVELPSAGKAPVPPTPSGATSAVAELKPSPQPGAPHVAQAASPTSATTTTPAKPAATSAKQAATPAKKAATPAKKAATPAKKAATPAKTTTQIPTATLRQDTLLLSRLRKAVTAAAKADGWADLAAVGSQLQDSALPGRYGYAKLRALMQATAAFDWRAPGTTLEVRPKASSKSA